MRNTQIITTWLQPNTWFKPELALLQSGQLQINVRVADGFLTRLRGLLWAKPLQPAEGLLLSPCNNIHTIGMTYAIDLIFLSADMQVLHIVPDCKPYRFANCKQARHTLELLAGQAGALNIHEGMQLIIEHQKLEAKK